MQTAQKVRRGVTVREGSHEAARQAAFVEDRDRLLAEVVELGKLCAEKEERESMGRGHGTRAERYVVRNMVAAEVVEDLACVLSFDDTGGCPDFAPVDWI